MPNPSTPDYYLYYYMSIDASATPSMLNRASNIMLLPDARCSCRHGCVGTGRYWTSQVPRRFSSSTSKNKSRIDDLFFSKKKRGKDLSFFWVGATRRKIVDIASPVHRLHTVNRWRLTTKKQIVVRTGLRVIHVFWLSTFDATPTELHFRGLRRQSKCKSTLNVVRYLLACRQLDKILSELSSDSTRFV
jgi:hypothetical protein